MRDKLIKFERPTKATDVVDVQTLKFPLLALPKYDGVYANNIEGKLLGRSLKAFKNKWITKQLSKPEYLGFTGELIVGNDFSADDLCRNTTSHVNTIDKENWSYTWLLFDYVHEDVINLPYKERLSRLKQAVERLSEESKANLCLVPYTAVESPQSVVEAYNDNLDKGLEGLILRCPVGRYKNNRSTLKEQLFLRMKPQSDKEAIIISVFEAEANNNEAVTNELGYTARSSHKEFKEGNGMVGSFACVDVESGRIITVGAGKLTHDERKDLFINQPIGSIIKYRSMDVGIKDAPRFARFYSFRAIEDMDDSLVEKTEKIILDIKAGVYGNE